MIIIPTNPDINAVPGEQKEALHPQRFLAEGAVIGQPGAADPQPVLLGVAACLGPDPVLPRLAGAVPPAPQGSSFGNGLTPGAGHRHLNSWSAWARAVQNFTQVLFLRSGRVPQARLSPCNL